jgi:exopolysaccharide production protein ExoQ
VIDQRLALGHAQDAPAVRSLGAGLRAMLPALELLAVLYVLAIAAQAHAIVDVLLYGSSQQAQVTEFSLVSRIAWPIAYLAFAALAAWQAAALRAAAARVPWILLFPLVALASIAWSLDPATSANASLRLAVSTLIGVYIGARFGTLAIAWLIFWVIAVTVGASVLLALAGLDFTRMLDGTVRGIFYHKNTLGNRSALLLAAAAALLVAGHRPLTAVGGLVVGLAGLVLARSGTSIVAGAAVFCALSCLLLRGRSLVVALRLALVGCLAVLAVGLILFLEVDPVREFLGLLGKDITLTGRIYLWNSALAQIGERPWLGTGFDAFWTGAIDWRTHLVLAELGNVLHFHDTYLEVGVQLGALGLIAATVALLGYARLAVAHLRVMPGHAGLWPVLFLVVPLVTTLAEYDLFARHNLANIVFVALAVAMARELAANGPDRR